METPNPEEPKIRVEAPLGNLPQPSKEKPEGFPWIFGLFAILSFLFSGVSLYLIFLTFLR